mgnify:CR=1 FL=1
MASSISRLPIRAFTSLQKSLRDRAYAAHQRLMPLKGDPILVVGSAHKVGSTWVANLLSDLFRLPRLRIPDQVCAQPLAVVVPIEFFIASSL